MHRCYLNTQPVNLSRSFSTLSTRNTYVMINIQNSTFKRQVTLVANKIIYRFGIILFIIGAIAAILQNSGVLNLTELVYPCLFYEISGIYCPGCGGTRSVKALLEGHIVECFFYHPFVFYCFIMYILFMGSHTLEKLFEKMNKKRSSHKKHSVRGINFKVSYVYIGIIILLLQWMIKNLIVLCSNY